MKDRTPTQVLSNGAIRYGIYDDKGTLLRYEYIKPEDDPTQVGTPLNKATLLSDKTAEGLGLSGDPSVNDAINVARGNVGDIMLTTKSTLGEDWVLCNGNMVDETAYPVLANLMPSKSVTDAWDTIATAPPGDSFASDGNIFAKFHNETHTIYYTTDPYGAWSAHVVSEFVGLSITRSKLYYMNNQWVLALYTSGSSGKYRWDIWYASEISGPYVKSTIGLAYSVSLYDFMYGGGYYIASVSSTNTMRYATSLDGTWETSQALTEGSKNGVYYNGKYVFLNGSVLYYADTPTGPYTTQSLSSVLDNDAKCLCCENGLLVVGSRQQLVYASSVVGPWTKVQFDSTVIDYIDDIRYADGHWVVAGTTGIAVSTTDAIGGEYTRVGSGGANVEYTPGRWLASTNIGRGIGPQLPSVSVDGCYAFIRAKV